MSTPQSTAIEANGSIALDSDLDADSVGEVITSLAEEVTELKQEVTELHEENEQLRSRVSDLEEQSARDRAEIKSRVSDLEEDGSGDETPTSQTDRQDTMTPIERLSDGDHDTVTQHVTPSIERAVTLFEHVTDWGSPTPHGYTLRPADSPKQLLEAATGESLAWQQYYRAAEALEQLSRGAVTFFDHNRHGKTLVLHDDTAVHDRLTDTTAGRSQSSLAAD